MSIWFEAPAWFMVAWLGIGVLWIVAVHLRDRRKAAALAARRPAVRTMSAGGGVSTPFNLTVYERNIFGLRQQGDVVMFGPSGRQVAAAALFPLAGLTAVWVGSRVHPAGSVLIGVSACAAAASAFGITALRVRVRLTHEDLRMRGRVTKTRRFDWNEIEDVRCELAPANVQWRAGPATSAVVGVVQVHAKAPIPIPGFRCLAWAGEGENDNLAETHAKVNVVRRYRESIPPSPS